MPGCLVVTDLVARAGNGEKQAWDALVERYSPLIWSICCRHRLGDADAYAVGLRVWRQLVHQLDEVPDPGVLAGWLAAAAWRECGNVQSAAGAPQISGEIAAAGRRPGHQAGTAGQERLTAEPHATLREAFSRLSPCCQQLLTLLIDGRSVPDAEISARLGIPAGGVGAARHRCLDKLRRDPAIAALTSAGTTPREMPGRAAGDDHQHNASGGPARDVAVLMEMLVRAMAATRAVEIGTFTGYSALAVARGLGPGGRLLCCDVSQEWTTIARAAWQEAGLADRIELRLGPGLDTLRALPPGEQFDFAFIDADKTGYARYYEEVLTRLRPGGLILLDNTLQDGRVVADPADDQDVAAIRSVNDTIAADPRVTVVLIPIGDGLSIVQKLGERP